MSRLAAAARAITSVCAWICTVPLWPFAVFVLAARRVHRVAFPPAPPTLLKVEALTPKRGADPRTRVIFHYVDGTVCHAYREGDDWIWTGRTDLYGIRLRLNATDSGAAALAAHNAEEKPQ